jgi:hypothetical protein
MAAITGTLARATEFGGEIRAFVITCVPTSASDTITLTVATHGVSEILDVFPFITAGQDAALQTAYATFSGLVITLTSLAAAGTVATDWTGATVKLLVFGKGA